MHARTHSRKRVRSSGDLRCAKIACFAAALPLVFLLSFSLSLSRCLPAASFPSLSHTTWLSERLWRPHVTDPVQVSEGKERERDLTSLNEIQEPILAAGEADESRAATVAPASAELLLQLRWRLVSSRAPAAWL